MQSESKAIAKLKNRVVNLPADNPQASAISYICGLKIKVGGKKFNYELKTVN